MPAEIELLKLVCARLENAEIAYMLTGSVAANFYAVPRMTRDIDEKYIVSWVQKLELDSIYEKARQ